MNAAQRLLAYRPRSEAELEGRLGRRGIPREIVEDTISRLRSVGLTDDERFAREWTERRLRTAPRSGRMIARELTAKGVRRAEAAAAVDGLEDVEAAYRAASSRARVMASLSPDEAARRLTSFLLRRGFDRETIRSVLKRLGDLVSVTDADQACR